MTPRMLHKMAEELAKPEHPAKSLAKGIAGFGLGMGGGYLGTMAADKLLGKVRGYGLQKPEIYYRAVPLVAGAAGIAAPFLMASMLNKMREDHLARQEKKDAEAR